MYTKEPKEFLIRGTRKLRKSYRESDATKIFEQINIDIARQKHRGKKSLDEFFNQLDEKLKT